jgi:phenylalanyl-tRNA synthetase beta chain
MVISQEVSYQQLEEIAVQTCGKILESVNLFDIYQDKKLGEGTISYAMSFVFRDKDKTLKDQQVDQVMNKLVKRYEKEVHASIRK